MHKKIVAALGDAGPLLERRRFRPGRRSDQFVTIGVQSVRSIAATVGTVLCDMCLPRDQNKSNSLKPARGAERPRLLVLI